MSIEFDVETAELERLKRIVSSSFEEIDKIERDLIDDSIERRIAQEIEKSEKLIQQIEDNSRIEESFKKELIEKEQNRLASFVNEQEIKAGKNRIKNAEALRYGKLLITTRNGFDGMPEATRLACKVVEDVNEMGMAINSLCRELPAIRQLQSLALQLSQTEFSEHQAYSALHRLLIND